MATDTAMLAERFRNIRQEWDLNPGEAETQAQNRALDPLHAWLRTGVDRPEVVIRAVQVLMADPERPAIHKRPAVNQVIKQISQAWESAGLKEQDVLILRGMLLATWTEELSDGGFRLTSLLNPAWMAIPGRISKEKRLEEWLRQQLTTKRVASPHSPQGASPTEGSFDWAPESITVDNIDQTLGIIERLDENYTGTLAKQSADLFRVHQNTLTRITTHLDKTNQTLTQLASTLLNIDRRISAMSNKSITPQLDILWWGQAQYSSITRRAYRRIPNATERLWWMAWESSELAMSLAVEPAASFLIETLHQLDTRADAPKRPLKEWLAEFIDVLRRIHEDGQHVEDMSMSERLKTLAGTDPLGLPVTWARLQAASPKRSEDSLEERIRTDVAVDPETLIDLGDWAAWIFREALLDRHLDKFGEQ